MTRIVRFGAGGSIGQAFRVAVDSELETRTESELRREGLA